MKNGCIMDTFPIVKRKDEAKHGHYRTKTRILEIYDEMAEAMKGLASSEIGKRYAETLPASSLSRHHLLPGPPVDKKVNFIPMARWDPNNWPEHIHPPRET